VDQTENLYHINLSQDFSFDSTEEAYDIKEIHKAVHALPKEYRIPFAMHISGFKYKEIAAHLGVPIGTVKSRIFFTRQKLQKELRDFR
jgi:RNA polymerase sigma-70 factor (ECF subfamily)